jgi:proline iminopeptidase
MALTTLDTEIAAHFFSHLAADYDVRPQLSQISCPTLVIVGRHDWICTPAAGVALAQVIPDARLVELPDAGHFGFSETPAAFLAHVRAYVARLPRNRSTGRSVAESRAV